MASAISPHEALRLAVRKARSQSAIARITGVSQPSVWAWLNKGKGAPADYVLNIEAGTGVSRHLLRPDIYPLPDAELQKIMLDAGLGLGAGSHSVVCDRTAETQAGECCHAA